MVWIFVAPQNSNIEILMSLMVLGHGAFGKWLGHEGGVFMNDIKDLMKEAQESFLVPSTMWEHSKKWAVYNSEEWFQLNLLCCHTDLRLSASRPMRNIFLLFISHQSSIFCCNSMNHFSRVGLQATNFLVFLHLKMSQFPLYF